MKYLNSVLYLQFYYESSSLTRAMRCMQYYVCDVCMYVCKWDQVSQCLRIANPMHAGVEMTFVIVITTWYQTL